MGNVSKYKSKMLFSGADKKLREVRDDLFIPYDHGNKITLCNANKKRLAVAIRHIERALRKLNEIK